MKKLLPIVAIVLVVAGGAILLTRKHSPTDNTSNMSNMGSNSNSTAVTTDKVSISNFSFSPSSITIKKGTTVTWSNHDGVAHTIVETDGKSGPNSQNVGSGEAYSFTYNTVGMFAYHCSIHPEMTGTVTVTE